MSLWYVLLSVVSVSFPLIFLYGALDQNLGVKNSELSEAACCFFKCSSATVVDLQLFSFEILWESRNGPFFQYHAKVGHLRRTCYIIVPLENSLKIIICSGILNKITAYKRLHWNHRKQKRKMSKVNEQKINLYGNRRNLAVFLKPFLRWRKKIENHGEKKQKTYIYC